MLLQTDWHECLVSRGLECTEIKRFASWKFHESEAVYTNQGKEKDLLFFLTEEHHFSVVEFDATKGKLSLNPAQGQSAVPVTSMQTP